MTIAIYSTLKAMGTPKGHIVIVSNTDRQAGELFMKITSFIEGSPVMQEVESITQRSLIMKNGCRITALPTGDSGSTIRGMTADVLIMEEAAYVKDSIVNEVLMPMVAATGGQVIKISTPFGMNHFYKSFDSPGWDKHVVDYKDALEVKHFEQGFIDEQKRQLGKSSVEFRTEYGAEFIADQDNYFGYELIDKCINDEVLINKPREGFSYFLGADVARFGGDATVLTIVQKGSDMEPHKVVWVKEFNKLPIDQIIEEIYALHGFWHFLKIYIDETGLGAGVTDVLKRRVGEMVKSRPNTGAIQYGSSDMVVGVTFTLKSKIDIYSNLRTLMEQGRLLIPSNRHLVHQLRDFRYELSDSGNMKLHHSEGGRDDYPDSLALAVKGLKEDGFILDW